VAVLDEAEYASKDDKANDAADVKEFFSVPVIERGIY
jgi:hypothetical protein